MKFTLRLRYPEALALSAVFLLQLTSCIQVSDLAVIQQKMPTFTGSTVEYEGQHFTTTKNYNSYDAYKNDPNNFSPEEFARIAEAVRNTTFLAEAPDYNTVMNQLYTKGFPGFAHGNLGAAPEQQEILAGISFEIPGTQNERVLGYVRIGGKFVLVADFETPMWPMLGTMRLADNTLEFCRMGSGEIIHSVPAPEL